MKKLITLIALVAGLVAYRSSAADTNTATATTSVFNGNELSLSLDTAYVVDTTASNVKGAFSHPYELNLKAGAAYFFTRNLGVEANVPFYNTKDSFTVEEVQAGALFRVPVSRFAPYVGLGGVYNWRSTDNWAYIAKAGLEVRLINRVGVFTEANYRNDTFQLQKGATTVAGGLRIVL